MSLIKTSMSRSTSRTYQPFQEIPPDDTVFKTSNDDGSTSLFWTNFPPFPHSDPTVNETVVDACIMTPPEPIRCHREDVISPPMPRRNLNAKNPWNTDYPTQSITMPPDSIPYEIIGPNYHQIYRVSLPDHLIARIDEVIEAAEEYAEMQSSGWSTYLYSLTKQDLAIQHYPKARTLLQPITDFVVAQVRRLYHAKTVDLDSNQPHILKYSDSHRGVQLHHDCCSVTVNLALSYPEDYMDGGTYIPAVHQTLKLKRGEFILHPGSLVHGGKHISGGTRYLLVYFCNIS